MMTYNEAENEKVLQRELDLVDEKKRDAHLRNVVYKQRNARYYNKKVRKWTFEVESLVL